MWDLSSPVKVTQSYPTLQSHGLYSPWNSPGQDTGVGSLSLLQGIFPTQVSCTAGEFFTVWAIREVLGTLGEPKWENYVVGKQESVLKVIILVSWWMHKYIHISKHIKCIKWIYIIVCELYPNLENSAMAKGLEKVSLHSNPKERQCQRMLKLPHNCTHLTH